MRRPTHREAYPRLDIRDLPGTDRWRQKVCRYTDENDREVGQAFIVHVAAAEIDLMYRMYGDYFEGGWLVRLAVEHSPDAVDPNRQFFLCPKCGMRRKTLFFKPPWACADCHGLKFRVQLLQRDVKIYERNMARRNELYAKLKNGRPHRMRQATFDREQRELARLNNWLKKARPKASSADHRYIVRGDWLPAKDLPSGLAVDAYSVQNGELVKEDWFSPPPKFRRDVG